MAAGKKKKKKRPPPQPSPPTPARRARTELPAAPDVEQEATTYVRRPLYISVHELAARRAIVVGTLCYAAVKPRLVELGRDAFGRMPRLIAAHAAEFRGAVLTGNQDNDVPRELLQEGLEGEAPTRPFCHNPVADYDDADPLLCCRPGDSAVDAAAASNDVRSAAWPPSWPT
jgi:hypothetical protein